MGYTPILLKLKIKIVKFGKDVVQLELPYPAGGSSDIINIWENCFLLSSEAEQAFTFSPGIPLLLLCNRHAHAYTPKGMRQSFNANIIHNS